MQAVPAYILGFLGLVASWPSLALAQSKADGERVRDGYTDSQAAVVMRGESSRPYEDPPYDASQYQFSGYAATEYGPAYGQVFDDGDGTLSPRPTYSDGGDYRQPVAIEFVDASTAMIATKLTGQLLAFNTADQTLRQVYKDAARSWGTLAKLNDRLLAASDQAGNCIVIFERRGQDWAPVEVLPCPGLPHSMAWSADSRILHVTGQWSQRLFRFQLEDQLPAATEQTLPTAWGELPTVDLPMCGGAIALLPKRNAILVMDAFGRDFAIIDANTAKVIKHDRVYGHNISQIAVVDDGRRVMFTHQLLNEFAQSTRGDITWGGLLSNNIRWLQTERMFEQTGAEIFSQGSFYPIGTTGDGAGDPSSFSLSVKGQIAVTLGGTDRIAIADLHELDFQQFPAGYRPVDCAFAPDGQCLVAVNQFSDSLTMIEMEGRQVTQLQLGELREPTRVERGERLFFHSRLAHDGWMSCHSCHSQGHTNGQLNDNLTDGTFGTPKRILSLLGQAETRPYSWAGKFDELEQQVLHSIRSTMATDHPIPENSIFELAAFIRSLPAPPSLLEARGELSQDAAIVAEIQRGKILFGQLGCAECHAGKRYTIEDVVDVGLTDEDALSLFNPPSLISVSQRQNALFHDGRAQSIRDVVEHHQHQLPRQLSADERDSLIRFMLSL